MMRGSGKLCDNGSDIWLKMQGRHDLKIAQRELGDALDKMPELWAT